MAPAQGWHAQIEKCKQFFVIWNCGWNPSSLETWRRGIFDFLHWIFEFRTVWIVHIWNIEKEGFFNLTWRHLVIVMFWSGTFEMSNLDVLTFWIVSVVEWWNLWVPEKFFQDSWGIPFGFLKEFLIDSLKIAWRVSLWILWGVFKECSTPTYTDFVNACMEKYLHAHLIRSAIPF